MHAEYTPRTGEVSDEEQYEAAGWVATVNVIKDYADQYKREQLDPEVAHWIGKHVLWLGAVANNDPASLVPVLERWRSHQFLRGRVHVPASLSLPRFYQPRGTINHTLQSAHELLYSRDDVSRELAAECNFQRLEEHIVACHDYNMQTMQHLYDQHVQYGLGHGLLRVRHDSTFYVGMWDNEARQAD